jgi:hypothetical protein
VGRPAARLQRGHVEGAGTLDQLGAHVGGGIEVAGRELDVDQHSEQLDRPQPVLGDEAQRPPGGGPGEIDVPSGEVEPSRRQEAVHRLVLAEEQGFGVGQPALTDAQVGEGEIGMPAGDAHQRLEVGLRPRQHRLGLAPAAQLDQQAGLHAVAVGGEIHGGARGECNEAVLAQQIGPGPRPLEVAGVIAGGEERAHGLGRAVGVVGRAAGEGHGLVQQGHALGQPSRLDEGQAAVGEGLGLQVHVTEAAGTVEGELGRRQQLRRVVDLAAHRRHRHPTLLHARGLVLHQPLGPGEPRPAGGQVAQPVGEGVAQTHAGHRRAAAVTGGGERPDRRRKMGDRGVDVELRRRRVSALQGELGLLRHSAPGRLHTATRSRTPMRPSSTTSRLARSGSMRARPCASEPRAPRMRP